MGIQLAEVSHLTQVQVAPDEDFEAGAAAMRTVRSGRYPRHRSIQTLPFEVNGHKVDTEFGLVQQLAIALKDNPQDEHVKTMAAGALSVSELRPECPNRIAAGPKDQRLFQTMFGAHDTLEQAMRGTYPEKLSLIKDKDIQGVWVVIEEEGTENKLVLQEVGKNADKPDYDKRRNDLTAGFAGTRRQPKQKGELPEPLGETVKREMREETGLNPDILLCLEPVGDMNVRIDSHREDNQFWVKVYRALVPAGQIDMISEDGDTKVIGFLSSDELAALQDHEWRGGSAEALYMAKHKNERMHNFARIKHR
jgi:ADP-ribose pyrophosphatase YjhB (NUDIX family)